MGRIVLSHKPKLCSMSLPKMVEMISCKAFQNAESLNHLIGVTVMGAPLTPTLYDRIETAFRSKQSKKAPFFIHNLYGATEMGAAICMTGLSDPPHKKKISVGRACQDPEFKIKIEDDDEN